MNYFKYLFSDKKALPYWAFLYFFIFLLILIGMLPIFIDKPTFKTNPIGILLFLFWTFSFVLYYTSGYINLIRQKKFLKKYSAFIDPSSIQKRKIEIYRSSYKISLIKTAYPATMNPKAKIEEFTICNLENLIVLIGQTIEIGILRKEICPIVIDTKNYIQNKKYKYAVTPNISVINWKGNDMEIIFESSVFGISKITLIDWKIENQSNSR